MHPIIKKYSNRSYEKYWFNTNRTTLSEQKIASVLKNRDILRERATAQEIKVAMFLDKNNVTFIPQLPVFVRDSDLVYWADFFIPKNKIVIEVDGSSHNSLYNKGKDLYRDKVFEEKGFTVIRVKNNAVNDGSFASALAEVIETCSKQKKENTITEKQLPHKKYIEKCLDIIIPTIRTCPDTEICFKVTNRHIIKALTTNKYGQHELSDKVNEYKNIVQKRGLHIYWKFETKKSKKWMENHENNNVTRLYVEASHACAKEYKLNV